MGAMATPWWRHQIETFSALLANCVGIHRSPVNSPHKGQWRRALIFSLICVWINGWVNNREAGDLRRYRAHYDVTVMSNHQPHDCLLNRLFRRRSKKTSKVRLTGLCEGNSPVNGEFPTQRASNTQNVSIWWRHYVISPLHILLHFMIPVIVVTCMDPAMSRILLIIIRLGHFLHFFVILYTL